MRLRNRAYIILLTFIVLFRSSVILAEEKPRFCQEVEVKCSQAKDDICQLSNRYISLTDRLQSAISNYNNSSNKQEAKDHLRNELNQILNDLWGVPYLRATGGRVGNCCSLISRHQHDGVFSCELSGFDNEQSFPMHVQQKNIDLAKALVSATNECLDEINKFRPLEVLFQELGPILSRIARSLDQVKESSRAYPCDAQNASD